MKIFEAFEKFSIRAVFAFCLLIGALLSFWSGIYTYLYKTDYSSEFMDELPDSLAVNLLWMAAAALGLWFVGRLFIRLSENKQQLLLTGLAVVELTVLGILLAFLVYTGKNAPMGDQAAVYQSVIEFSNGNYRFMEKGAYLDYYPQQYGLIFLLDMLFKLLGRTDIILFQYLNVLFLVAAVFFGWRLTRELFQERLAELSYLLLTPFFFPLYFYVYFAYGEVISISMGTLCLWAVVKFCRSGRLPWVAVAACSIAFAVFVRKNSLILLIAAGIVLIFSAVRQKKPLLLTPLVLAVLLVQMGGGG